MTFKNVIFAELPTDCGKQLGVITLDAPSTLNALTLDMVEAMLEKLDHWQRNDQLVGVLIRGAGDKAFCAGGDVQQIYQSAIANPGGPCPYAESFFEKEYRLDYLLHTYAKPIIGWGHGIVMGGGLGIFAGCAHRVVTETTRIAMPEITIGLYPDVGGSHFLNQMPGQTGRFLALTGASINAADSLYLGLAENFICQQLFDKTIDALLSAEWSTDATFNNRLTAKILANYSEQSAQAIPDNNIAAHREVIENLCQHGSTEQVVAAICDVKTDDRWLAKARDSLAHGSPISARLIDRQLNLSTQKSLKAVFCSELILSINIIRHGDFAEGVRALLIDKDKDPRWQFKNIQTIPEDFIAHFFIAPWENHPLADL